MFIEAVPVALGAGTPVSRISVTALQRLVECQLKYRLTYIDGHRDPVSARGDWSMGKIVHGALQRYFGLSAAARARTADLWPLVMEEWRAQQGSAFFQYAHLARNIAEGIFQLLPSDVLVVSGVEVPVQAQFAGIAVTGRIDLIYTAPDGRRVIADYKTRLIRKRVQPTATSAGWQTTDWVSEPPSRMTSPLHPMRVYDLLLSERYDDPSQEVTIELLGLHPPERDQLTVTAELRAETRAELEGVLSRLQEATDSGTWVGHVRDPGCKQCPRRDVCPAAAQAVAANPKLKFRI